MMVGRWMVFPVGAVLSSLSLSAQTTSVGYPTPIAKQSINASWIGWYYTPTTSFFLSAIGAQSNGSIAIQSNRSIKFELWSARPEAGGTMLRSRHLRANSAGDGFQGGFTPLLLQAGIQYFVGFRDVEGLGFNATDGRWRLIEFSNDSRPVARNEHGAGPPAPVGSPVGSSPPVVESPPPAGAPPVVELPPVSSVPEPLTMALVGTGLLGLAGVSFVRRLQRPAGAGSRTV